MFVVSFDLPSENVVNNDDDVENDDFNLCFRFQDGGSCLTTGQGSRCTTWWLGSSA